MVHRFSVIAPRRFAARWRRHATARRPRRESGKGAGPRRAFTLVEVLTVLAIVVVLLAISVPILTPGFTGPALTGASSSVASGLEQARARSLALGNYTGLFVMSDPGNPDAFRKFALFEIAELDETGLYEVHDLPEMLTEWEVLPDGVVFVSGLPRPATILDLPPSASVMGVRVEGRGPEIGTFQVRTGGEVTTMNLHGIVFAPDGSVAAPLPGGGAGANGEIDLAVVEGVTVDEGERWALQLPPEESRRFEVVRVGPLSGSVRVIEQENYD